MSRQGNFREKRRRQNVLLPGPRAYVGARSEVTGGATCHQPCRFLEEAPRAGILRPADSLGTTRTKAGRARMRTLVQVVVVLGVLALFGWAGARWWDKRAKAAAAE